MTEQVQILFELRLRGCVSSILGVNPFDQRLVEVEVSVVPGQGQESHVDNIDIATEIGYDHVQRPYCELLLVNLWILDEI